MTETMDFADTAAIIANLDVVVSVDTSVVHLAGAMGKPVMLLDRYDNCWRWLSGREDSPWYPGLRIFRQDKLGDWRPVIARVATALTRLAAGGAVHARCRNAKVPHDAGRQIDDVNAFGSLGVGCEAGTVDQQHR